ncbi:ferric-chelate reductase [Lindgomyces ingoldianus]|uniref:Ferric-chelate reductase n=1 Tax=Lindgomyces ingoldianus TaxID=673940 RepID=A0ACB6QG97_9PLEO|nr:ferric-chelate reductase [Lindgomyces ingoldianus]KAF2465900.1 ferric-chelate reductase [Lindgomyces ingoldianus]
MAMGSMSMEGLPPLIDFPKMYWAVVGTAIGVATFVNMFNHMLYRHRLSAAKAGVPKPAKPRSPFLLGVATIFAIMREASNFSIRMPIKNRIFRLPTVGRTSLVVANLVVLIALCFYGFNLNDRWSREDIGYRTGFVSIGQLPLIFLLAGKNNVVGYLSGISHERLNWLHRWCARCLLVTVTIHMGYFFADWAPYNYIGTQLKENTLVWKGVVAWAMLVWIVFSSMTPIRGWCYEVFVLQHLASFAVLIGFIYIHTPAEVHIYIWLPVGLFFFDRVVRALRVLYANISLFHPKQRKAGQMSSFWACKAEFTPLPHKTTRITIHNPPISWTPGQHVFLSCHSIVPLQSHPFTIASIPEDGKMEFLVKAETGGTKRFFRHAEKTHGLSASSERSRAKTVAIEGPYGFIRPLRQFDSIVLLAGSTGATFTVPLLRDVLQGWKDNADPTQQQSSSFFKTPKGAATRHVRFIWVVKSRSQLGWFSEQLSAVWSDFQTVQQASRDIKLEMTVYITCDDSFTEGHKALLSSITAPNSDPLPKKQREPQRGPVELRGRTPSLNEKEKAQDSKEEVKEVTTTSLSPPANACGSDGACCCRTSVDEAASGEKISPCCCSPNGPSNPSTRPLSLTSSSHLSGPKQESLLHPSISIVSGRPNPKTIIRRSLEQALGESAVVVCGPHGLVADVKQDVCSLSDERAVHKGTGAQGIYLHTESFGY